MKDIVYIAGYGRSGSTLLDAMLGASSDIFSAGELAYFFHEVEANGFCSCGASLRECSVWGNVIDLLERDHGVCKVLRRGARITRRTESFGGLFRSQDGGEYAELWSSTLTMIKKVVGDKIVVDSSKSSLFTALRVDALARLGYRVKVVHLVRHPFSVIGSVQKGSKRALKSRTYLIRRLAFFRRTGLSWLFANRLAEKLGYRKAETVCFVRYEDLVEDPIATLRSLSIELDLDASESVSLIRDCGAIPVGHRIGGNRMLGERTSIVVRGNVEEAPGLAGLEGVIARTICARALNRYGYTAATDGRRIS